MDIFNTINIFAFKLIGKCVGELMKSLGISMYFTNIFYSIQTDISTGGKGYPLPMVNKYVNFAFPVRIPNT